jgi:hypothetical protein
VPFKIPKMIYIITGFSKFTDFPEYVNSENPEIM